MIDRISKKIIELEQELSRFSTQEKNLIKIGVSCEIFDRLIIEAHREYPLSNRSLFEPHNAHFFKIFGVRIVPIKTVK